MAQAHVDGIERSYPFPDRLRAVVHPTSRVELERIKHEIKGHQQAFVEQGAAYDGLHVVRVGVNERENVVEVGVQGDVEQTQVDLDQLYGGGRVVVLAESMSEPANRDAFHQPTAGGLVIRRGSSSGSRCSSGFVAINAANNTRWLLTAGHCDRAGFPTFWQGSQSINPLQRRNIGSLDSYDWADVAAINLVSSLWTNRVYRAPSTFRGMTSWWGGAGLQGGLVEFSTGVSNLNTLREIHVVGQSLTFNDPYWGTYQVDGIKGTIPQFILLGDSGSPVFQGTVADAMVIGRRVGDWDWIAPVSRQLTGAVLSGLQTTP